MVKGVKTSLEDKGNQYPTARIILPSQNPPRVSYENYENGVSCGDVASKIKKAFC